jgi:hypothetical protein
MAKEIKYKFANYDGGLEAHPVAERAGSFVLSGSWWELHFKHTYEIANGELSDYALEALPIDRRSCLVSIREPEDDGEILCSFVLPDTSAERLLSDLDQRSTEQEAGEAECAEEEKAAHRKAARTEKLAKMHPLHPVRLSGLLLKLCLAVALAASVPIIVAYGIVLIVVAGIERLLGLNDRAEVQMRHAVKLIKMPSKWYSWLRGEEFKDYLYPPDGNPAGADRGDPQRRDG